MTVDARIPSAGLPTELLYVIREETTYTYDRDYNTNDDDDESLETGRSILPRRFQVSRKKNVSSQGSNLYPNPAQWTPSFETMMTVCIYVETIIVGERQSRQVFCEFDEHCAVDCLVYLILGLTLQVILIVLVIWSSSFAIATSESLSLLGRYYSSHQ